MREFEIKPKLERILSKLFKKDKVTYEALMKKIEEVASSPDIDHYKNLKYALQEMKRIQIGHFVLVFSYDKRKELVSFLDFDHHDKIYKR